MSEQYDQGDCTICTHYFSTLHWHHTIPRALGGENSLQIPLCGDCHTTLHAHASALVAKITNNSPIKKNYWPRPGDAERAEEWIGILVRAMMDPVAANAADKQYLISTKIDQNTHAALGQLKKMIGAKTLKDVYLYCIAQTLKQRGLYNEHERNSERSEKGVNRFKAPETDLW